jgi:hypothetical protein
MILKMSHKNLDTGRDEWSIYDNIVNAVTSYNQEEKCKMVVVYFKGGDFCGFPIRDAAAYLCNDDGKTIEAIYPEITKK